MNMKAPLVELLQEVPVDSCLNISSTSCPVGVLCHNAAAEIKRLKFELEDLGKKFEALDEVCSIYQKALNRIDSIVAEDALNEAQKFLDKV